MPRTTRNSLHAAYYAGDISPYAIPFVPTAGIETPNSENFETACIKTTEYDTDSFVPMSPDGTPEPDPELDMDDIHTEMTDDSIAKIVCNWLDKVVTRGAWIKHVTRRGEDGWEDIKLRIMPRGHFTCARQMKVLAYTDAINQLCLDEMVKKFIVVSFVDNEDDFDKDF